MNPNYPFDKNPLLYGSAADEIFGPDSQNAIAPFEVT